MPSFPSCQPSSAVFPGFSSYFLLPNDCIRPLVNILGKRMLPSKPGSAIPFSISGGLGTVLYLLASSDIHEPIRPAMVSSYPSSWIFSTAAAPKKALIGLFSLSLIKKSRIKKVIFSNDLFNICFPFLFFHALFSISFSFFPLFFPFPLHFFLVFLFQFLYR